VTAPPTRAIRKSPSESLREFYDRCLRQFPKEGMAALHKMAYREAMDLWHAEALRADEEIEDHGPEYHMLLARRARLQTQDARARQTPEPAPIVKYGWERGRVAFPHDAPTRAVGNRRSISGKLKDGFLILNGLDA